MTDVRHRITLNGVEYYIVGSGVIAQPVSDWIAALRLGDATYDTRTHASFLVFDTLDGGMGILSAREREHMGRFADSEGMDTVVPLQMLLPPLQTAVAAGGGTRLVYYRSKQFLLAQVGSPAPLNANLFYSLGNTVHAITGTGAVSSSNAVTGAVLHMCTFQPRGSTASRLYVVEAGATTLKYSLGGSFTAMSEGTAAGFTAIIGYDDKLFAVKANTGEIITSVDGNIWVKDTGGVNPDIFGVVPQGGAGFFVGVFPGGPQDMSLPYFCQWDKLYILDAWTRKVYPIQLGLAGPFLDVVPWDDHIVATDGFRIVEYYPSQPGLLRDISPHRDQGLPRGSNWLCVRLWGVPGGRLYALFYNGTNSQVWEWGGVGWHPLTKKQAVTPTDICHFGGTFPGSGDINIIPWIILGHSGGFYRARTGRAGRNPIADPAYQYEAGPLAVYTPWLSGGFEELRGALFHLWFAGEATPTETVKFEYQVDGESSPWVFLSTFTADNVMARFANAGVSWRRVRFRITLNRGAAGVSPNGLPFILVFDKKPPLRLSYLFALDQAQHMAETGTTFKTLYDTLRALWDTDTLIPFSYGENPTTYVRIVQMPTNEQDIRDAMLKGQITIQLIEPVDPP